MVLNSDQIKIFKEFVDTLVDHGGDGGGSYDSCPKEVEIVSEKFMKAFDIENIEIKCNKFGCAEVLTK